MLSAWASELSEEARNILAQRNCGKGGSCELPGYDSDLLELLSPSPLERRGWNWKFGNFGELWVLACWNTNCTTLDSPIMSNPTLVEIASIGHRGLGRRNSSMTIAKVLSLAPKQASLRINGPSC